MRAVKSCIFELESICRHLIGTYEILTDVHGSDIDFRTDEILTKGLMDCILLTAQKNSS